MTLNSKSQIIIWTGLAFLLLGSIPANPFGVDFLAAPMGKSFDVDVYVEGTELADPYDDILFFAWQSVHKGGADLFPETGGHWGFQILPIWRSGRQQPIFTFNFGWDFHYAVLPLGVEGTVVSASHPDPYTIDVSARMKAEMEENIAANPTNPNLFLSYGAGRGIYGTPWSETTYNYIPWSFNTWYRVSFTRDESPLTTTAWVLKRNESGIYYFPEEPESATVFGWSITIQPEIQNPDGTFTPQGPAMELPPLYLDVEFDRLETWASWGEAFDDRPRYPILFYQQRPRVRLLSGSVQEIPGAKGNYWGYDQPSNDYGPVGNSQLTHTFYFGYSGAPVVDGVKFELMRRNTRDRAVLWDQSSPLPGILPETEIIDWPEDSLRDYFSSFGDVHYLADEVVYEDQTLHVNRRLVMREMQSPWFEYSELFGPGVSGLVFDAHAANDGWLLKNEQAFKIRSPSYGRDFHVEVEVYDPNYINRVGWLDFKVRVSNETICTAPIPGDASGDCKVNYWDLAVISFNWLTNPFDCPPNFPEGDLNNDCLVNFLDFAKMALDWLDCNLDPPEACWE